jgi:hypothetical protein
MRMNWKKIRAPGGVLCPELPVPTVALAPLEIIRLPVNPLRIAAHAQRTVDLLL